MRRLFHVNISQQKIAAIIVGSIILVTGILYGAVEIILSPKPTAFAPGTLVTGSDNLLYLGAELNNNWGIVKITQDGNTSMFSDMSTSNMMTADIEGKNIYILASNGVKHLALQDGTTSYVSLNPLPDAYLAGTLMSGKDANLYVGGTLSGNSGILKIIPSNGTVTMFLDVGVSNFMASDPSGENIFVVGGGKTSKYSIAGSTLVSENSLNPVPDSFSLGNVAVTSDDSIFLKGQLGGDWGILQIESDGTVSMFDTDNSYGVANNISGTDIYIVKTEDVSASSSFTINPYSKKIYLSKSVSYSSIDTTSKSISIAKYNIIANKIDVPQSDVKILGGANGYVNPSKGETSTVIFKANKSGKVTVKIFTLSGQLVWETSKETDGTKDYIEWACKNSDGEVVSSDVYIVKVNGPGIDITKKVAIIR